MKIQTIVSFTLASLLSAATFAAADSTHSTESKGTQKPGPMEHLQVWGSPTDADAEKERQREREALAQQVKREQLRALQLRQEAEIARFRAEKERAVAETDAEPPLKSGEQEAARRLEEQLPQPERKQIEEKAEEPT